MKILYVGLDDPLKEAVVQQLKKDGHKVSCVIRTGEIKQDRPGEFRVREFGSRIQEILNFVRPELVIYAGSIMHNCAEETDMDEVSQLQKVLLRLQSHKIRKLLYLSSLDVAADPGSYLGMIHTEAEMILKLFEGKAAEQTGVLRCGALFDGEEVSVMPAARKVFAPGKTVQPLHIRDAAVAIRRLVEENLPNVPLNLCGSKAYTLASDGRITSCDGVFSNAELTRLVDWTDIRGFIPGPEMPEEQPAESTEKKIRRWEGAPSAIRQLLENLALFALFLIPQVLMRDHSLFRTIDWMLIYVVVAALSFNMVHSTLAIVLACVSSLLVNKVNLFGLTSIYSYLNYLLVVAQYVFFGIAVSYTTTLAKNKLYDRELDYKLLRSDYEDLEEVHNQSARIMKEYENRILDSQRTLPVLQELMSRLNVLDSRQIFSEITDVVADLLRTKTVAVYQKNGDYLRLLVSTGEKAAMGGKSWNLKDTPEIARKLEDNEIAVGDPWKDEPAMAVPVFAGGKCIAVILVMELTMETRSLYYLNLMRMLASVASDAMERALLFSDLRGSDRFVPGTNVLNREEFAKQLNIQKENREKGIAQYTLLTVQAENWQEIAPAAERSIRSVDFLGENENGALCILLTNTTQAESAAVIRRLREQGIDLEIDG